MDTPDPIRIPLRNADGEVVAHALVSPQDAYLARHKWSPSQGYARRRKQGKHVLLHREILGLSADDPRRIDHRNRDGYDNRRENLRIATNAQNMQNKASFKGSSSKHRGVSWHKRDEKWQAYGQLDGKLHHLGYFHDEDEAGAVAAAWRRENLPFSVG